MEAETFTETKVYEGVTNQDEDDDDFENYQLSRELYARKQSDPDEINTKLNLISKFQE